MMKHNFKNLATLTLATSAMAANLLLPAMSFADTASSTPVSKNFCTRLPEQAAKVDAKLADRETKLGDKETERQNRLANTRTQRDKKLADQRAAADLRQAKAFEKLEAKKADTDAKKQAVAAFESTVNQAIATRRSAVDAAIQAFRNGVDQAVLQRKTAITTAAKAFADAYHAAITQAQTDCRNGKDSKTVKADLNTALKAARDTFEQNRKNIEKVGTTVSGLTKARQDTVEKAFSDFRATLDKAKTDLKTALGVK